MAGFLFAFRAVCVLVSARWLGLGTEAGVAAGIGFEVILLLMAAMHWAGSVAHPVAWTLRQPCVRWALLFLAFSGMSLAWSATVSIVASAVYWCVMAADVLLMLMLQRSHTTGAVAHSVMRGYIVASLLLAAIAWIIPPESDLRLGDLEYFNTNQIGNICAMGIFMAQILSSRRDGRWRLSLLFLALTLVRSLSKTTLIAFGIGQAFLLLRDTSMTRGRKSALAVSALVLMVGFGGFFQSYYTLYTSSGNQAETLTGRTGIWLYCLNAGLEKPWLGNGIDALWKVAQPFGPELFEARHAENEILQQFFSYGAVGVIMLAGIYGALYKSIRRLPQSQTRTVLQGLWLFILVRGLAEAEPFDLLLPLWCIVLISTCIVAAGSGESSTANGSVFQFKVVSR
jgi:O-antigen ligase